MLNDHAPLLQDAQDWVLSPGRQLVLVVDDDQAGADWLSEGLAGQGFRVVSAKSGKAGQRLAQTELPSLILLDLGLPDMDGLDLCAALNDDPQTCEIPIIIVSGASEPNVVLRSRRAGCKFFIRKPYDPEALLILIQAALGAMD